MSTKLEYFKLVIQNPKTLENKSWFINSIAIPLLRDSKPIEEELALYTKPDGLYYSTLVDGVWTPVKIKDHKEGEPLLLFRDKIMVDSSWIPTITKPVESTIGRMIFNVFLLYVPFGTNAPFINNKVTTKDINKLLVEKLRDEDKAKEGDIKISQMVMCYDRLTFISSLGNIINVAATRKTITAPDGLAEKKKTILKKYEGRLDSHIKRVEFENELGEIDKEYLADDVDAAMILTPKMRGARSKMYLTFGTPQSFDGKSNLIEPSLSDGIDVSRANLPQYIDELRYGSYSRGGSTAKSGYIYKLLQRALTSLSIINKICDTKEGLPTLVTESNYEELMNRSILVGGKWKILTSMEEAKPYIGKTLEVRSSMYCTSGGGTVCYSCLSEAYLDNEAGISNLAAVFSDALMSLFLKQMHVSKTQIATIKISDLST